MTRLQPKIGEVWISEKFGNDMVKVLEVSPTVIYVCAAGDWAKALDDKEYGYPVNRSWFTLRYRPLTKLEKYLNEA